jgi:tetratricopeptide (TPR) repeat protein
MATGKSYALVLAVALAATVPCLANGFVSDDVPLIEKDQRIHSLVDLPRLAMTPLWPEGLEENAYRPATTIALALTWVAGDGRPVAFRLVNVVVNLAVVALVLALALRVMAPGGAVVAALWFAVQPVHVEAVALGVGLAELLAAAGYLAAVLAYLLDGQAAEAGPPASWRRAALALAALTAAAVAYGAKENGITLPLTLLLVDLWQAHGEFRVAWRRFRRHAILWLGVLSLAVGYLAARHLVLGPLFGGGAVAIGIEGHTALGRALVMAPAVLVWLRWFLWPIHLSADYLPNEFVPRATLGLPQLAGFAALAVLALGAWRAWRRAPAVTAGLVFAAVTASLAANVVVPTGVILAERLAYLPSVGLALVVGGLWERLPRGRFLWPATAVVLGLLAARTVARIPVWRDVGHLVQGLRRDAPNSCNTHWAVGRVAFAEGARGAGELELRRAIAICPGIPKLVENLGEEYLSAGLPAPAERYLMAAFRLDTLRPAPLVMAILARVRGNRPDSAVALAAEAVRRFPAVPEVLGSAEQAYLSAGQPRQALALARRLVFLDARSWRYQQVAGFAAAVNGRCEEARSRLERAARLAPEQAEPREQSRALRPGPGCGIASSDAARSAPP